MTERHPFSPIVTEQRMQAAMEYIAMQSVELGRVVLGRELELDTLCFFAHSTEELAFLRQSVLARGPNSRFTHGATLYADTDFTVLNWRIKYLGVRDVVAPDPTRQHIGYGDYAVADYADLLAKTAHNPHVNHIASGQGVPLIELRHPDFDVLGFVVSEEDHQN